MDKTFLTVRELALKLGVSEKTVYRMINTQSIPFAIKIGGQWRFNAEKIDKWALESQPAGQDRRPTNYQISVSDVLSNGLIIYRAHGETRDEILDEILAMISSLPGTEVNNIKRQILYSESIISSSLQGLCLMAPDVDGSYQMDQSSLLVAFLEKPMDFAAVDKKATEIVLLLLAANKTEQRIIKTKLTRLLMEKEFIAMLKQHPNRRELIEQVLSIESEILS